MCFACHSHRLHCSFCIKGNDTHTTTTRVVAPLAVKDFAEGDPKGRHTKVLQSIPRGKVSARTSGALHLDETFSNGPNAFAISCFFFFFLCSSFFHVVEPMLFQAASCPAGRAHHFSDKWRTPVSQSRHNQSFSPVQRREDMRDEPRRGAGEHRLKRVDDSSRGNAR